MKKKIKETCSCGASFEYEEKVDELWQEEVEDRQAKFHKAHESCRKVEITGTEIKPNPRTMPSEDPFNKIYSQPSSCMHDNCPGCRAGICNSGVHMMSCPCPKCNPRF